MSPWAAPPDGGAGGPVLEPVAIDPAASLPLRAAARHGARVLDVVVLATPADVPALRGAPSADRSAPIRTTVPTSGLPLVRSGRATVLGPARTVLAEELLAVSVVVREGGRIVWSRAVRARQVHAIVADDRWVADLHVLAATLPYGAFTGTEPVGAGLRLALAWEHEGRQHLAAPRSSTEGRGPFDALA